MTQRCPRGHHGHDGFFLVLVIATAAFTLPSPLAAFEVLGKWSLPRLSFAFNPNFPDQTLAGTPEEQTEIILCAARAWETQSAAGFEFLFQGPTTVNRIVDDGVNAMFWADMDGRGALAATLLGLDTQTDTIRNFDIVFYSRTNDSALRWSGPGEPPGGTFDIGGIATHELGHALGLAHSTVPAATMFASASGRGLGLRTLHADDRGGIEFLYGGAPGAEPQVELTSVEPGFGFPGGGDEVILSGVNFTYDSDTLLRIDGMTVDPARWTVETCGLIRVRSMPPHDPGTVDITVSNTFGSSTLAGAYRYGLPAPRIFSLEPNAGPLAGGISVTVTGEHFTPEAVIDIDGKPLEDPLFVDAETIVGTVPPGDRAGFVDVGLTQGMDTFSVPDGFFYNGYGLKVATVAAPPASNPIVVGVSATSPDPLGAISFGLLFDSALVTLDDITVEGTLAQNAAFASANIDNDGGVATYGLLMSFSNSQEFPAGSDRLAARIVARTRPTAPVGAVAILELAGDVGSPSIRLIFTPAGSANEFTPATENGAINIAEGVRFVRGDANDDGTVNITDALTILNVLFNAELDIRCGKAMDANDDGDVNVSDAVWVLNFLFASGRPILPPYPEPGIDPTPDALPCDL